MQSFTADEVAKHNSKEDLWLIIENKVYDLTNWQEDHPGGPSLLLQFAGGDATGPAKAAHKGSKVQLEQMEDFYIGELLESSVHYSGGLDADENIMLDEDGNLDEEGVALDDAAEEINVNSFEELRVPREAIDEAQKAWNAFIGCYESTDLAAEAIYASIFDSAPTLQSLFKTPRAIQSMRFMHELGMFVEHLDRPKQLKALVESLAFRHLNLEVTVPRAMIFRDAVIDLFDSELQDRFTTEARQTLTALLGWVGGANIFVRANFGGRIKLLTNSWLKANKRGQEIKKVADSSGTGTGENATNETEKEEEEDLEEGQMEDFEADAEAERLKLAQQKTGCCQALKNRFRRGNAAGTHAADTSKSGALRLKDDVPKSAAETARSASVDVFVPTTFKEMFEFNSAVMGFANTAWLMEVLNSFDAIVTYCADANRLQEECDILVLRIGKSANGPVNLSQFRSCMLASLRSLLPKDWDSNYEVAWNWLWENVERLITKNMDNPPRWEAALASMMASFSPEKLYQMRSTIYDRFFVMAPSGQEYFKQSDTRLQFIAEKVFQFTQDLYKDPWQMVDDISGLGLRHVGYGVPTDLFGAFVTSCCEVVNDSTDNKLAVQAYRWALGLISKTLVRTINEGSTIVMKAVNANSGVQLRKALLSSPRGERAQWCLKIQVGTHSISPLMWAIESGSLNAAKAIIQDLLLIRADRERYYFGADEIFGRHPDIIKRICRDAPSLLPPFLVGLVWRSTRTQNGLRRANYYVQHLIVNKDIAFAECLRDLCSTKDPKIMTHAVTVTTSDILWNGVVFRQILRERIWFFFSLIGFMMCHTILQRIPEIQDTIEVKWINLVGRSILYLYTMCRLILFHLVSSFKNFRKGNYRMVMFIIPWPKYLNDTINLGNLLFTIMLICMCIFEPYYRCAAKGIIPSDTCDNRIRRVFSIFSMIAMLLHWLLMVDFAVFSTGLSAFILVCAQIGNEIGRFFAALSFMLLAFASAMSTLQHSYLPLRDIPNGAVTLFSVFLQLYEDDWRSTQPEPALLCAFFAFDLFVAIVMMNLLVAQLNSAYNFISQDMIGYARLNRAQRIVETLTVYPQNKFQLFVETVNFNKRLEFNEGDVGISGGIQVLEPAGDYIVLTDTVVRYGGSCAEDMQWPEDQSAFVKTDPMSKVERMAKKMLSNVMKGPSKSDRRGRSGASASGAGSASEGISGIGVSGAGESQSSAMSAGASMAEY
jgi:hemoglobin-like flavoprotein